MANSPRKIPAYRLHKPSGRAVVRLDGRDVYLGRHGSPESHEHYDRVIGEWLATCRTATRSGADERAGPALTVAELLLAFWRHAQDHYRAPDGTPSEELGNIKAAIRPVRQLYAMTPAGEFGPLALRCVRDRMVADGLMRTTINSRVNRIRRAFKWAASLEMVPVATVQALATVAGLQKGRTKAREPEPVGPVASEAVERVLPFLSRPVAGMVRLQLLTGMRPGEACMVRGCDIRRGDATWTYRPASHKTAWRGKVREVVLGPKAQDLLATFAKEDPAAYLFDPREAVAEHHAARSGSRKSRATPGERSRRAADPGVGHSRRYNRTSYLNAVSRACDRAFPHPILSAIRKRDRTPEQAAELDAWQKAHRWHPNQLRHSAATAIRAEFGLEAAQAVLGHAKADTTEIYAERDLSRAREVMGRVG